MPIFHRLSDWAIAFGKNDSRPPTAANKAQSGEATFGLYFSDDDGDHQKSNAAKVQSKG